MPSLRHTTLMSTGTHCTKERSALHYTMSTHKNKYAAYQLQ